MKNFLKSLSEDKTRFALFHKLLDRDHLPLQVPVLKIDDYKIERLSSVKFLGVMLDINLIENKFSKNVGLLHEAKQFLNAKAMKSLYFSFIIRMSGKIHKLAFLLFVFISLHAFINTY